MALQTNYSDNIAPAVAGLRASQRPATIVSRNVETSAGIAFGAPVAQGTADKGCVFFASGAVLGITVLDHGAVGDNKYNQYESASVMTQGDVWVVCTTGCIAGDGVWVRPSDGTFQNSSANSGVAITGARWGTSASAGALAVIELA